MELLFLGKLWSTVSFPEWMPIWVSRIFQKSQSHSANDSEDRCLGKYKSSLSSRKRVWIIPALFHVALWYLHNAPREPETPTLSKQPHGCSFSVDYKAVATAFRLFTNERVGRSHQSPYIRPTAPAKKNKDVKAESVDTA